MKEKGCWRGTVDNERRFCFQFIVQSWISKITFTPHIFSEEKNFTCSLLKIAEIIRHVFEFNPKIYKYILINIQPLN